MDRIGKQWQEWSGEEWMGPECSGRSGWEWTGPASNGRNGADRTGWDRQATAGKERRGTDWRAKDWHAAAGTDCITLGQHTMKYMSAVVVLPFPPSVNHYWRVFRGTHYISKKGKEYRAEVCRRLKGIATMTGPIALEIVAHRPDRRSRDLDNLCKAPLDALTHAGAYEDDSQIHRLCIRWAQAADDAVPGGALVVRIETMQES